MLGMAIQTSRAESPLEVIGSAYRADVPFPQFQNLWSESWSLKDQNGEPLTVSPQPALGAYIQIYIRNTSAQTVAISDLQFAGTSLNDAIAFGDHKAGRMHPANIHFSKLSKIEIEGLKAAGDPVWWKADPASVPPDGFAEITLRLRRNVRTNAIQLAVLATNVICPVVVSTNPTPSFAGISFSPSLDGIYCYLQNSPAPGVTPVKIFLDDTDVTPQTTAAADSGVNIIPLVIRPAHPLAKASFHCFRAVYADGSVAITGLRTWSDELVYGMWGYSTVGKTAQEKVDYYLGDLKSHNVNAVMESYGGDVAKFLSGETGVEHSRTTGIRAMRKNPGKIINPLCYFLYDEPDAHDSAARDLEPNQRLGALGRDLVRHSNELRTQDPQPPQLLNLDNTYKPENWYMYARLPDICCADPYFQEQQRIVWNSKPSRAAAFVKPTYVLGVATICNSACAPKPSHFILNSVRHDSKDGGFRFATPAEKTVELFYALGAGAKGFSYWWYTPTGEFYGCGAKDEAAVALWHQIGLLGAQIRTAGPVITRSCPAQVPVETKAKLWTRTLLSGTNTLVLIAVNDNIACDRLGTVVVPLPQTVVCITPPGWLKADDIFEITPQGLTPVTWEKSAGKIILNLGQTDVARMIVLTSDHTLRDSLDQSHRQFNAN